MLAPSSLPARPPVVVQSRYQVVRALGAGAQATVYLVYDLTLRQWRALKIAMPEPSDVLHARFMREARLMARLSHPHVIKIFDVMTVANTPAIVTELARGGSVAAWMRRHGRLPPALAAQVAAQCASALAHAHAEGVLHRDVKPGNVLLHADGRAVLADFGIARHTNEAATALTEVGWVVGTLTFMAPEQRRGAEVSAAADIYALGATLYTMCTARRETELFLCDHRPAMLAGIPGPLAAVIHGCCRYDAADRIGTMAEVRAALLDAATRCPPVPNGTPALNDAAMALPELSPTADGEDPEIEALRERLGPSAASERQTPDTGHHDLVDALPYRMPRPDRRQGLPDPWDESDPTSLPTYVEKLYPRNRVSMGELRVVGLSRAETFPPAPAVVERPKPARFPVLLAAAALTLSVTVGAGLAAWHETARLEAVLDARADLVNLVAEQRELVPHLVDAGVEGEALVAAERAFDRATSRLSHAAAAEFAERVLLHRDRMVEEYPDDARELVRLEGVLEAWRRAEACRFLCGGLRSGRTSVDGSPGW